MAGCLSFSRRTCSLSPLWTLRTLRTDDSDGGGAIPKCPVKPTQEPVPEIVGLPESLQSPSRKGIRPVRFQRGRERHFVLLPTAPIGRQKEQEGASAHPITGSLMKIRRGGGCRFIGTLSPLGGAEPGLLFFELALGFTGLGLLVVLEFFLGHPNTRQPLTFLIGHLTRIGRRRQDTRTDENHQLSA